MGAEASYMKIFWSELDVDLHTTALELLGERGELLFSARDATEEHNWMSGYLFSLSGPIYAGTNEIQRNIVAERVLGLPRK
jgi:alkylation response protein AidB-like acyl-CoA dehydrogenase